MISGYNGTMERALAVAVSSRTAGNYTLTVRDHASLGFLTVRANQTVSITGAAAPTGQLALVDAAITVMAGGTLVLRAVHVAQDVTVQPGGAVQNLGSLVSSDDDNAPFFVFGPRQGTALTLSGAGDAHAGAHVALRDRRQHGRPRLGVHVDIGERDHDTGDVRGEQI